MDLNADADAVTGQSQRLSRAMLRTPPRIRRMQRLHATVMTAAPLFGVGLAVRQIVRHEVSALELVLLGAMYTATTSPTR